jgi:murein DD-endopeptidase MepM/ murein hydrolase activator NlpD
MLTEEREAYHYRIKTMYEAMLNRFHELDLGDDNQVRLDQNTSYFHHCRQRLVCDFCDFEQSDYNKTMASILDSTKTDLDEFIKLDQLMTETLAHVGVQLNLRSVEELLEPKGHLVENVTEEQKIPAENKEDSYWLLTEDGSLEFHGGGWLKNSSGFILDPFGKQIGSEYIESGLDNILNYGVDREANPKDVIARNDIIDNMLESCLNYYVPDEKDSDDRKNWYWDLSENEGDRYRFLSEEKLEILSLFGKTSHDFSWPVTNATVTSAYGPRPKLLIRYDEEVNKKTNEIELVPVYSLPEHHGLDITGNTTILSIEKGYVYRSVTNDKTYGNNIYLYHGNGISSRYCHLDSIDVIKGQTVEKGAKVGVMGMTGSGTGIHLHFEIIINSKKKGPTKILGINGANPQNPGVYISGNTYRNKME